MGYKLRDTRVSGLKGGVSGLQGGCKLGSTHGASAGLTAHSVKLPPSLNSLFSLFPLSQVRSGAWGLLPAPPPASPQVCSGAWGLLPAPPPPCLPSGMLWSTGPPSSPPPASPQVCSGARGLLPGARRGCSGGVADQVGWGENNRDWRLDWLAGCEGRAGHWRRELAGRPWQGKPMLPGLGFRV